MNSYCLVLQANQELVRDPYTDVDEVRWQMEAAQTDLDQEGYNAKVTICDPIRQQEPKQSLRCRLEVHYPDGVSEARLRRIIARILDRNGLIKACD